VRVCVCVCANTRKDGLSGCCDGVITKGLAVVVVWRNNPLYFVCSCSYLSRVRVCVRIGCTDTTYRLGCLVLVFRSVVCVCVSCIGSSTRTIDFFRKNNSDSDPFVVSVSYSYNC